jgi:hypothetical protein
VCREGRILLGNVMTKIVTPAGLEPATFGSEDQCSTIEPRRLTTVHGTKLNYFMLVVKKFVFDSKHIAEPLFIVYSDYIFPRILPSCR